MVEIDIVAEERDDDPPLRNRIRENVSNSRFVEKFSAQIQPRTLHSGKKRQ